MMVITGVESVPFLCHNTPIMQSMNEDKLVGLKDILTIAMMHVLLATAPSVRSLDPGAIYFILYLPVSFLIRTACTHPTGSEMSLFLMFPNSHYMNVIYSGNEALTVLSVTHDKAGTWAYPDPMHVAHADSRHRKCLAHLYIVWLSALSLYRLPVYF